MDVEQLHRIPVRPPDGGPLGDPAAIGRDRLARRDLGTSAIGQVVEGVKAAKAVHEVAEKLGIEMPIVNVVYRILYEGLSPREAVSALMKRQLKPESA